MAFDNPLGIMGAAKNNDPGYSGPSSSGSTRTSRSSSTNSDLSETNPFGDPVTEADFELAELRKQILRDQAEKKREEDNSNTPTKLVRRRARSNSFSRENPLENPLTPSDYELAAYRKQLQQENEGKKRVEEAGGNSSRRSIPTVTESSLKKGHHRSSARGTAAGIQVASIPNIKNHVVPAHLWEKTVQDTKQFPIRDSNWHVEELNHYQYLVINNKIGTAYTLTKDTSQGNALAPKIGASPVFTSHPRPATPNNSFHQQPPSLSPNNFYHPILGQPPFLNPNNFSHPNIAVGNAFPNNGRTMNYQNYIDSPGGPGSNPRQAPPSPSQGMNHSNGMNGGMGMGGMVGYPTPAGHQSDLNYIMSMVDELSTVLRHNQQLSAAVVEKVGRVREKAATMDLSNDQLVAAVASELNADTKNVEKENSELRKALEKAEYDKTENWKLACHGANILADLTEKMHKFRETTDADILAWHKNYRNQLAAEREENLNLRNQINDMRAAACRANEHLRQMRRYIDDHDEWNELRVSNIALRQEKRFWKRMAMPYLPDNDSEFSDDDDLIDPEEKKRLAAIKAEKERKDKEHGEGGEGASA